jgi:hypothetical protein
VYTDQLDNLKSQKIEIDGELKLLKKEHDLVQQVVAGLKTENTRLENDLVKSAATIDSQALEIANKTNLIEEKKTEIQRIHENHEMELLQLKDNLEANKAKIVETYASLITILFVKHLV